MIADVREIFPAARLAGEASVPGDKSISHRYAMLAGIAAGTTIIRNFAASADSHSTLSCLAELGVSIRENGREVTIEGVGLSGLRTPNGELDGGNSGTTVRMMSGILAGNPIEATITGDASLSRRPMRRVIEPLRRMGATFEARDDNFLPMRIHGGSLKPIEYRLPVASAQVKSAVLLAGLYASGRTRVIEPAPTRNHTELALRHFGAKVESNAGAIEIEGGARLEGRELRVPGDLSSAAFLVAAALALPGSFLEIRDVGLNPTRSGFIQLLKQMGAQISEEVMSTSAGEPVGNLEVRASQLTGGEVSGDRIGNVIDEIPILAVLATRTRDGILIRDAAELRAKETDRIEALVTNLTLLGIRVEEYQDGLFVPGSQTMHGGEVESFGDHRIAMAFGIAGLLATEPVRVREASCAAVSFPGFFDVLEKVSVR